MSRFAGGFRTIFIVWPVLSWIFLLSGCVFFPAALITASAVGVQYSITNVAYKVFPEKMGHVRRGVDAAVSRMELKVHQRWAKTEDGLVMRASTRKHGVDVTLSPVTEKTTRLQVNAFNKEFPLLKDKALAAAVIGETEKELKAMGLLRARR